MTTMKEVIGAARNGATITIGPFWGESGRKEGIRMSVTVEAWNGVCTINRNLTDGDLVNAEDTERLVAETILEMVKSAGHL